MSETDFQPVMTPKMARAGEDKLIELGYEDTAFTDSQDVFLAMLAAAPDGLLYHVKDGTARRVGVDEERIAELIESGFEDAVAVDATPSQIYPDRSECREIARAVLRALTGDER